MAEGYVILKSNGPMRLANASFKIKQGQIARKPAFQVDPKIFDVFDSPDGKKNLEDAKRAVARNIELKNQATRHGVTSMQTLGKLMEEEAKIAPTQEDRERALKNAKLLTEQGLTPAPETETVKTEVEKKEEQIKKLENELATLRQTPRVNPKAYLDQNARTVGKRVKSAVKKKKLKKSDVEEIIIAEKEGQARKSVLEKLTQIVKDDVIFGKLFK